MVTRGQFPWSPMIAAIVAREHLPWLQEDSCHGHHRTVTMVTRGQLPWLPQGKLPWLPEPLILQHGNEFVALLDDLYELVVDALLTFTLARGLEAVCKNNTC